MSFVSAARERFQDTSVTTNNAPSRPPDVRRVVGRGLFGLVLASLPAAVYVGHDRWWVVLGAASVYVAAAFALRSRLVVCTLAGIGVGAIFDSGVKQDSPEARVWRLAAQIAVGTVIGVAAGVVWEQASAFPAARERPKRKKR